MNVITIFIGPKTTALIPKVTLSPIRISPVSRVLLAPIQLPPDIVKFYPMIDDPLITTPRDGW